jgi:uncharacterized protein DUF6603
VPTQPGTLEQLAQALGKIFDPLRQRIEDGQLLELVAELGIDFPDSLVSDQSFTNALSNFVDIAQDLPGLISSIIAAIEAENYGQVTQLSVDMINKVKDLVVDIETISNVIDAKKGTFPGLTPAEVEAFAEALPKRLLDYLMIRQIEDAMAPAAAGLDFIGVFQRTEENVGSTNPLKPPFTKRELNLSGISDFLNKPGDVMQNLYGWGSAGFNGRALLQKLEKLALELGLPAVYTDTPTPTLDVMFLEIQPQPMTQVPGLRLRLHSTLKVGDTLTIEEDQWAFDFSSSVEAPVEAVLTVSPDGDFVFTPPGAEEISGQLSVTFRTKRTGTDKFVLIGEAEGSRLEFEEFHVPGIVEITWNPSDGEATADFSLGAEVKGGLLVIDLSGSDGFIGEIMSGVHIEAQFEFAFGYSTSQGFYFRGSSGLEIQIPIHIDLSIAELMSLTLGIGLKPEGIPVSLGADIKANLGPLQAVVQNMGLTANFNFADDRDGNLGPVDLGFSFKPPNGVGLSIDAAVVKGGGFLFFDFDKEEYAGILELAVAEIVTVKAIGLITTRMPDGSSGFSLLIIISVEFQPIQLGFGFTLNGLGGLLGLNRTMRIDQLAEGVRTGAVESVMFPEDIIANAPRIISDLKRFFPPENGIFLIGPMAKLGWGTPSLITASLGIIIEIPPGNIVILGVLKCALPDDEAALLVLQVNFIGAFEFDKKRIWFFASLFESRVLFITIEGEMGLLIAWGDDANFVISVGGFHPAFNPPPLPFPSPRRIALSILNESYARIRVEGYFAVTSNTAQFGASIEVFFGVDAFNIDGHLAFDALFQFSPFYFIITISASLSVKVFGIGLFSVRFRGQLEGTSPWHIEGEGSISLLFWDIDVPFSHTWGEAENTTLPPIAVVPILTGELDKIENWTATIPSSNSLLVSLRKLETTEGLVLHPLGTLRVTQRAVPLDLMLDKVGAQQPSDANRFTLQVAGGDLAKLSDRKEQFATVQFKKLSDSQKLAMPAYEPQNGGVELSVSGNQVRSDRCVRRTVRYETIIIDSNFKRFARRFSVLVGTVFNYLLGGNMASKSMLSAQTKLQKNPVDIRVSLTDATYVVASMQDNTTISSTATFSSRAQANDFMNEQIRNEGSLANTLHVIPATEMRRAA